MRFSRQVRPLFCAAFFLPAIFLAPQSAQAEELFLRVIAPLDEARGYCLDIPGHMSGVRLESPLQVHTCKHGIWHLDGLFDTAAITDGALSMPNFDLCVEAQSAAAGASLLLRDCSATPLQSWYRADSGEISLTGNPALCITIAAGAGRDAGGPRYLARRVGLERCDGAAAKRQRWTFVTPGQG